jgi:hypothetical protein
MKYSLKSSYARMVLILFFVISALTIVGRSVSVTEAWAYCDGFPFCVPSHPLGWLKQSHIFLVGVASILMFFVVRKAWRNSAAKCVVAPRHSRRDVFGRFWLINASQHDPSAASRFSAYNHTVALWVSRFVGLHVRVAGG